MTSLASEREPCPGTGWIPELRDRDVDQAPRGGVDRARDDMPDIHGVGLRLHQRDHDGREVADIRATTSSVGLRPIDGPEERERHAPLESHQVGIGNDTHDEPICVRHREVVDTVLQHQTERLIRHRVVAHGDHGCGHHLGNRDREIPPSRDDLRPEISIRHDAEEIVRAHEDRGDRLPRHRRRSVPDGHGRGAPDRVPVQDRRERDGRASRSAPSPRQAPSAGFGARARERGTRCPIVSRSPPRRPAARSGSRSCPRTL